MLSKRSLGRLEQQGPAFSTRRTTRIISSLLYLSQSPTTTCSRPFDRWIYIISRSVSPALGSSLRQQALSKHALSFIDNYAVPEIPFDRAVERYAVTGGVPKYLAFFQDARELLDPIKKGHNARQYPCRSSPAGVKSVIKLPACCFGRSAAGRHGFPRAKNKRLTQFSSFTLFKPVLGGSFVGADFARGSCEAPRSLHLPACFCIPKDV